MTEGKRRLIRLALEQRAEHDDQWGRGWWLRPGDWEFGPFLPRLWGWAVALKCALCILLKRAGPERWTEDWIMVAAWDGERCNGYPEADYNAWKELRVRRGWRPSTWRYDARREST